MSKTKIKETTTYEFGTGVWVKLLSRVWWPGTVVDPLTVPPELLDYINSVEYITVVKFEQDSKYEVVGINDQIFLYSSERKIEFVKRGVLLYNKQKKGLPVIGQFDMDNFKKDVISMERDIGGDIHIFENLEEKEKIIKLIIKQNFIPTNTKKSKKKKVHRKFSPVLRPKNPKFNKIPNQPKPKPVSKQRTSIQLKVGKTYKPTASTGYTCHSQVGSNFTTNRNGNLKRLMAIQKNDTTVVMTKKLSTGSTSNKRKNLKTKSQVKKQKLQEVMLKDWDKNGEDKYEELNTSQVQSASNVAQSSIEEVLQTMSDVQSSSYVVQFLNEKVVQTMSKDIPTISEVIPVSKVSSSENDVIPTVSETFESLITPDFINNTIFYASTSVSHLVEETTKDSIDKPHKLGLEEFGNEITKSTELLLEKTVNTSDQINNFENSLSCISSSINNSDVDILTEDNNVFNGISELSECESLLLDDCLWTTANLYEDIYTETYGIDMPLVENLFFETEDCTIVKENTNDKEIVSNDVEINQLNSNVTQYLNEDVVQTTNEVQLSRNM